MIMSSREGSDLWGLLPRKLQHLNISETYTIQGTVLCIAMYTGQNNSDPNSTHIYHFKIISLNWPGMLTQLFIRSNSNMLSVCLKYTESLTKFPVITCKQELSSVKKQTNHHLLKWTWKRFPCLHYHAETLEINGNSTDVQAWVTSSCEICFTKKCSELLPKTWSGMTHFSSKNCPSEV